MHTHRQHQRKPPCESRCRHLRGDDIRAIDAVGSISTSSNLSRLRALSDTLEACADGINGGSLGVGNGRGVAPVGIDASKDITIGSSDTIHDNVALIRSSAVAASTVQLAKGINSEVRDGKSTGTVVLKNLVGSSVGTAALDVSGGRSVLVLDGESILADCRPPDICKCACALAMDTFDLVGADDDIGDGTTFFDLEDGIRVTSFSLACARNTTVKHDHPSVKGAASSDCLCSREN